MSRNPVFYWLLYTLSCDDCSWELYLCRKSLEDEIKQVLAAEKMSKHLLTKSSCVYISTQVFDTGFELQMHKIKKECWPGSKSNMSLLKQNLNAVFHAVSRLEADISLLRSKLKRDPPLQWCIPYHSIPSPFSEGTKRDAILILVEHPGRTTTHAQAVGKQRRLRWQKSFENWTFASAIPLWNFLLLPPPPYEPYPHKYLNRTERGNLTHAFMPWPNAFCGQCILLKFGKMNGS